MAAFPTHYSSMEFSLLPGQHELPACEGRYVVSWERRGQFLHQMIEMGVSGTTVKYAHPNIYYPRRHDCFTFLGTNWVSGYCPSGQVLCKNVVVPIRSFRRKCRDAYIHNTPNLSWVRDVWLGPRNYLFQNTDERNAERIDAVLMELQKTDWL